MPSDDAAGSALSLRAGVHRNINSTRLYVRREGAPRPGAAYVLYWMQIHRRLHSNFALEYAVSWANALGLPLLIYEGLRCDYPWASDRFQTFIFQGMAEHAANLDAGGLNYYCYAEDRPGAGAGLLEALAEDAALLISDEFPAFIMPIHNRAVARSLRIPFATVDANGVIPMALSEKAPYSAYIFRQTLQKRFQECWRHPPQRDPLASLRNRAAVTLPPALLQRWPDARGQLADIRSFVSSLPIDHSVAALPIAGARAAALERLHTFCTTQLLEYADRRNDPDAEATSRLSPYLHFGKISAFEMTAAVFAMQPEQWRIEERGYNGGSRGYFGGHPSVDAFLDEALTWRETGYHFCHHERRYDRFDSLPDWARQTLKAHARDRREHLYDLQQFEAAQTHDPIWNAAQRQLRQEGYIHNYLRMLWGKKILEWTRDPLEALEVMIELNNKYSIDGRNPNSYSGIFWTLGRFDRPWQERPIFGQIRYMSSEMTRKKVRLQDYLRRFGEADLFSRA